MKVFTLLLLPLALAACATDAGRRDAYLAAHPQTDNTIAQNIYQGKISKGMSKDEVRAAWGDPCGYCVGTRSASWGDSWEYNIFGSARPWAGNYVFFGPDGRVTGWSK